MEHVGIGEKNIGHLCPDLLSPVWCGVTIIDLCRDIGLLGRLEPDPKVFQLVLLKGLQGEDVQGPGLFVFEHFLKDAEVVNQGFAACCGRGYQDVGSLPQQVNGLYLMTIDLSASLSRGYLCGSEAWGRRPASAEEDSGGVRLRRRIPDGILVFQ